MKKIIIIILLLGVQFSELKAQNKSPEQIIQTFFKIYKKDKEKAFAYLYVLDNGGEEKQKGYLKSLNHNEKSTFLELIKSINNLLKGMGEYLAYEVISTQTISPSLKRTYCLVKYKKYAYILKIDFYKPHKVWKSLDIQLMGFSKLGELINKL